MSTYAGASLIYYPSGYKVGKAYSLKPTDGSGDLTFTRASSATRVNSDGLIEKVRTNLALESNTLSTAPNVVDSSTTTANVYVSPDGTQNAMRFTETTANDRHGFYQYYTVTAQAYTTSIFTKQTGRRYISLSTDMTGTQVNSFFDLQTESVLTSGSGHTCSVENYGNGWLRLIVSFTASAGFHFVIWGGSPNGTTISYAGSTSISQTFYGYQLEASSYPTSYIPTTSTAVSVGITSNVPRIDYTGGGCGKLLLEPQRTNLFDYSEDFSQWAANAGGISSIEPNYAISPEGVENAYKVNFVIQGDSDLALVDGHSVTGGATYAYSIYIKGEGSDIGKDIVVKSKRSSGDSAGTTTTQTLTGEWVRVDFITTYAANNTAANFYISSNDATSCLIYGAQAEAGSYATSYIPTTSTAVTRVADIASKSGISSLIGQTEGTLFVEFTPTSDLNADVISLVATTALDNAVSIGCGSGLIYGVVYTDPNYRFSPAIAQTIPNNTFKVALCYKNNDFTFFINGVKVASGANSYSPSSPLTRINFNQALFFGNQVIDYKSVLVFPAKLSDADAIALTA